MTMCVLSLNLLWQFFSVIGNLKNAKVVHNVTNKENIIAEGYSTAVVESLVLGVPVLTTDVSVAREIIDYSNCGIIVDNS